MLSRLLPGACALLCLFAGRGDVEGKKWPGRAGGDSASGDPELLLTFDDGPHEKHTERILDALDEHGHQAIFFWTGHRVLKKRRGLEKRLAMVDRAVESGHLVGNHTISHPKMCTVSSDQAEREIDENADVFEELTDLPMILFRVPYGARCRRLDKMLEKRDLQHLHWDLDPQEFRHRDAEVAFRYVTRRLKRLQDGKRAVLLMHDTQPASAKALPKILKWVEDENERREKRGRRPIRIIDASSWVAEGQALPLVAWGHQSALASTSALREAATKLLPR
jgi:peptidoglycan/xylan/chitin deacetylase (PgdA/CDA1 family)